MNLKKENELINSLFKINSDEDFEKFAIEVFQFQYLNNAVYKKYIDFLDVDYKNISQLSEIPFLPIAFFKSQKIMLNNYQEQFTFLSSGTTGKNQSKHFVFSEKLYQQSILQCFKHFYGSPQNYRFLALLPAYLERTGSSLIYMVKELMKHSNYSENKFYLSDFKHLASTLKKLEKNKQKYVLLGVTYALLDFAKQYPIDLSNGIVMETGGMKGKRKELTKKEVHDFLKDRFNILNVHSEYGMTELLSQAYSKGNGLFSSPKWMKILIRDAHDPFSYLDKGKSGGINIIDFANFYSCAFIETKDLGRINQNGQFEVLGRFDNSDIRGCNLLVN